MPITINGSGTVTGISAGGLPDGTVDADTLAANAVTDAKIAANAVTDAKIASNAVTNAKIADDAVAAAEIADNAVGLAALAGIARGKIIIGDSNGDPAVVSPGSADQVLTSDGTDVSWADAGGSGIGANLIHNPEYRVWQRGTTVTGVGTDGYAADRWKLWSNGGSHAMTVSRDTEVPAASTAGAVFPFSAKLDVTTSATGNGATWWCQRIEKGDVYHIFRGGNASQATYVTFWAKSNKTGTYCFNLQTSQSTQRCFVKEISMTNSWQKFSIAIPADTAANNWGGNPYDQGVQIGIVLTALDTSAGGNQDYAQATNNTWQNWGLGGNDYALGTSNQVNFFDSTSNEMYITGWKWEVGTAETAFNSRSYGEEINICQRYFEPIVNKENAEGIATLAYWGTGAAYGSIRFAVEKRTVPSMWFSQGSHFKVRHAQGDRQCSQMGSGGTTKVSMRPDFNASGGTNGECGWGATTSSSAYWYMRSEM